MKDYQKLLDQADMDVLDMPLNPRAWRRRGVLKWEYDDYAGAVEDFTVTLKLRKRHALTWMYRGSCHYLLGDYLCALSDYTMSEKIRPNHSRLHLHLAEVYLALENHEMAVKHCHRALSIRRNYFDALKMAGFCWLETETPLLGLPYLDQALKLKPFDTMTRAYRGLIYHRSGNWDKALDDYDISIALGPEEATYLNRAVVKMELDRYQSALEDAYAALELKQDVERCYELIEYIKERMEGESWKGI